MQHALTTQTNRDHCQDIQQDLAEYYQSLSSWNLHYDYDLWPQAERYLGRILPNLKNTLCLAMEYGLYEEVKSVFLEIRHLLQTAGYVRDRIQLAAWLRAEAERRQDWATQYLMTSVLAWTYTTQGCYHNLKKANTLWNELTSFLEKVGEPPPINQHSDNEYRAYLRDRQDIYPYGEMLIDIYETGARIAVKCARFEDVKRYIQCGRAEITALSRGGFLPNRLKERFDLAFTYQEGVVCYLTGQYARAQGIFDEVCDRGSFIAWTRLVRGAKSWLATIAVELDQYNRCESILQDLLENQSAPSAKRDAICHLISAQLLEKLGESTAQAESEEKAETALKSFVKEDNGECEQIYDVQSLRLQQPMLGSV